MKHLNKFFFWFFTVGIITLLVYQKIFFGFFQQDEWLSFAYNIGLNSRSSLDFFKEVFAPSLGHYQPFNTLTIHTLFLSFGLNYSYYVFISLILHLVIVSLIYRFGQTLFKDKLLAFFMALFFGISASIYQATAWVLADIGTHMSTLFAILSIINFFTFLDVNKIKSLKLSILFLFISLLFKETAIGLFLLLPISFFIFRKDAMRLKKIPIIIVCLGIVYLAIRISMIFMPQAYSKDMLATGSQSFVNLSYNALTFPFKSVSESLIPSGKILDFSYFVTGFLSEKYTGKSNTTEYDEFVEKRIFEGIVLLTGFLISTGCFLLFYKNRTRQEGKIILFGILLILLNSSIFALSPERSGKISVLDSRNLYFINIGTSMVFVMTLFLLFKSRLKVILVLIPILFVNIVWLNQQLSSLEILGTIRKNILNQIKVEYPILPEQIIFYLQSDKSYFGLAETERIPPFQSGFGQTLLIWYHDSEKFSKSFYEGKYLWGITEQGFKTAGRRGFGYFRDFDLMADSIKKNKIPTESIIGINFDSETNKVSDISEDVKGRVEGFLTEKKEIPSANINVSSPLNTKEAYKAIDGNRETFWDSTLPYKNHQEFDIDLGQLKKVAEVSLDSYNDKNQNTVGFKVSLSEDKQVWSEIFSAKKYPPQDNGLMNLFFKPTVARYVKIEQIGKHEFAHWVIHELKIYEAI